MTWDKGTADLTYWIRMMDEIYASVKWFIIYRGNNLSPIQRQAIISTNVDVLSVGSSGK